MTAGRRSLRPGEPGYPEPLASIPDAPAPFHVLGELPQAGGLAIVGARRPTGYGLRVARRLASEAARANIPTVSGLARGIDTEAHRATLEAGGVTCAVLGSGLGQPYPPENAGLMREVVRAGGSAASELPWDERPWPCHFPRRNRIISGLAWAVVVVEGTERSGSLITARRALEQGRDVFAVPGPVDSPLSEAPHLLIREGAAPVGSLRDLLDLCAPLAAMARSAPAAERDRRAVPPEAAKILQSMSQMSHDAVPFEALAAALGWPAERLAPILTELELAGLVEACPGQRYARR